MKSNMNKIEIKQKPNRTARNQLEIIEIKYKLQKSTRNQIEIKPKSHGYHV